MVMVAATSHSTNNSLHTVGLIGYRQAAGGLRYLQRADRGLQICYSHGEGYRVIGFGFSLTIMDRS